MCEIVCGREFEKPCDRRERHFLCPTFGQGQVTSARPIELRCKGPEQASKQILVRGPRNVTASSRGTIRLRSAPRSFRFSGVFACTLHRALVCPTFRAAHCFCFSGLRGLSPSFRLPGLRQLPSCRLSARNASKVRPPTLVGTALLKRPCA